MFILMWSLKTVFSRNNIWITNGQLPNSWKLSNNKLISLNKKSDYKYKPLETGNSRQKGNKQQRYLFVQDKKSKLQNLYQELKRVKINQLFVLFFKCFFLFHQIYIHSLSFDILLKMFTHPFSGVCIDR